MTLCFSKPTMKLRKPLSTQQSMRENFVTINLIDYHRFSLIFMVCFAVGAIPITTTQYNL